MAGALTDRATPNLPSRDFEATSRFYGQFGFTESWRDASWMILVRGGLILEFFPFPNLDPATSSFGSCLRLDDVGAFYARLVGAGIPETSTGWPRLHAPKREPWGGLVGALIDPDGTLLRLIQEDA